jgi:NAD/NADP transhydrogenase alpha subunit
MSEAEALENRTLISLIYPRQNEALVDKFAQQKATVLSLDSLLRTLSRGQAFDVLSSQVRLRESSRWRQPSTPDFLFDAHTLTC